VIRRFVVALILVGTGCRDYRGPHWEEVCVKSSRQFSHLQDTGNGFLQPVYVTSCYIKEWQCVVGDDYAKLYPMSFVCLPREH
jgi:hypothetical protein